MKKPDKSTKARKASAKRGKKRNDRGRKTQAEKFLRIEKERIKKRNEEIKFRKHLQNLMPGENF